MGDEKNPTIAGLLGFLIAGVGHMYAGNVIRGIPFLLLEILLTWLVLNQLRAGVPINIGLLLISLIISVMAAIDAAGCARRHNEEFFQKCPRCRGTNLQGEPACVRCGAPLPL